MEFDRVIADTLSKVNGSQINITGSKVKFTA